METEGLRRVHERDQAAAALDDVAQVERQAVRHSAYPVWFWLVSGVGMAGYVVSAGTGRPDVLVGAAVVVALALLVVSRGRAVHERCRTLGVRGWIREFAVVAPALVVLVGATAVAAVSTNWWVVVIAAVAAGCAWVLTGLLTGRVAGRRR